MFTGLTKALLPYPQMVSKMMKELQSLSQSSKLLVFG